MLFLYGLYHLLIYLLGLDFEDYLIWLARCFSHWQKIVIPAWMPESSHRDVKLCLAPRLNNAAVVSASYHPWHWILASMPVWRCWLRFLANQVVFWKQIKNILISKILQPDPSIKSMDGVYWNLTQQRWSCYVDESHSIPTGLINAWVSQTIQYGSTMWGRVRASTMASRLCLPLLCTHGP